MVPPLTPVHPAGNPAAVHQPDTVSQANTSPRTERKNVKVKTSLSLQIGDIEVVQIPTGLTKQTRTQDEDMTDHVKAGTT